MHQAAAGRMAIAQDHMPAGVLGRIGPDHGEQTVPLGIAAVVAVHDLHLPEVDGFEAGVDVRHRLIIEPHLRFQPAHVGNLAAAHGPALSRRVDDVVDK